MAREPYSFEPLPEEDQDRLAGVLPLESAPETVVPEAAHQVEPTPEPEQPVAEEPPFVWTGEGGMVQQQASAMDYFETNSAELQSAQESFAAEPIASEVPTPEIAPEEFQPIETEEVSIEPVASQEPQPSQDSAPAAEQDASAINRDSIEVTDAQMARAELLASMVEADEQSRQQELEHDYSQEM